MPNILQAGGPGTVTYFGSIRKPDAPEHVNANEALQWIREGKFRQQVEAVRAEADPVRRKPLKEALPLFCFSGRFTRREEAALVEHSGLLCLDLDKIPPEQLKGERERLQADPHTFAVFTSPSGNGLKALVRVPADKSAHRQHFAALVERFASPFMDKSVKDPARACFVSYDPDLYVNEGAASFTLPPPKGATDTGEIVVPPFPIDVFPQILADYARELSRCNNFPLDYTGAGFLFAASVAIGNSVHVLVKEGYSMPPVLWLANVGRPGTNKTHPLEVTLKHLKRRDADSYATYKAALVQWEHEESERAKQREGREPPKPRPVWRPHLVGDATMEALVGKLEYSPRGLGLHRDELAGWWGSMDQYRKGSDRERWLSLFSGTPVDALRRTAGEVLVSQPFVSVCGTVQPGKLYTLGKDQDGFLSRILFAYPDEQRKPYHSTESIGKQWALSLVQLLDQLLNHPLPMDGNRPQPRMVPFSEAARVAYLEWDRMNTDRANAAQCDSIAAIYPKLDTYVPRLALVLEMLHLAASGTDAPECISGRSMEGALKLVEYFETTARKVHAQIFNEDAVDSLPDRKARVYDKLPERFKTGEGQRIAQELGMSERTFKRFIERPDLFKREGHGMIVKQ